MNQDQFLFLELFGEVKEEYISQSSQLWTQSPGQRAFNHWGRKVACLALIVTFGFCLVFYDQVYAAIKRFTTMIGEALHLTEDLTSYTKIIGQTQTQGNLSLTLNEVILDEHRMLVSFCGEYAGGEGVQWLRINGKRTRINRISYPGSDAFSVSGNPIDTGEQGSGDSIVLGLDFADLELPKGEVNVHLVVNAEEYQTSDMKVRENYKEKDFIYDFSFSDEALRAQTIKRTLNIAVSDEDGEKLTFTDLTVNDLYCILAAKTHFSRSDPWIQEHALKLEGEDSLGNPVALFMSGLSENEIFFETKYIGEDEEVSMSREGMDIRRPMLPDRNCAYMELQLYRSCEPGSEEEDTDAEYEKSDGGDADAKREKPDEGDVDVEREKSDERSENNGWEPIVEKFRVKVNG